MLGFHEKRRLRSWLQSKTFLAFLLVPIGFLAAAAYNAYETEQATSERREELAAQLARLTERAEKLQVDIAELEDPRGIEAALRQRYEVGKEGEQVVVLVEEEAVVSTHATETPPASPTFFEWLTLFFRGKQMSVDDG